MRRSLDLYVNAFNYLIGICEGVNIILLLLLLDYYYYYYHYYLDEIGRASAILWII